MTPSGFRQLFKKIITPSRPDRPLHALDHRIAKEWIKKRLGHHRFDWAHRRADGEVKSFEMNLPSTLSGGFDQR